MRIKFDFDSRNEDDLYDLDTIRHAPAMRAVLAYVLEHIRTRVKHGGVTEETAQELERVRGLILSDLPEELI